MSVSRPAKYREWAARYSRLPCREQPVDPRRTDESSPTSKTGSAPTTGRRRAATCAPARRADQGRRSRRSHRVRQPRKHFEDRTRLRTPNTAPAAPSRHRRAGRKTTPPHDAACDAAAGPAASRPATGTADRDGHGPPSRSSTPSVRRPTRWPTESHRGDDKSPPRLPPRRPCLSRSAALSCGRVRQTDSPRQSRFPR